MKSNEIISMIMNKLGFKKDETEKDSFYLECPVGGYKLIVIRLSNHRTYLQTWADRYKPTQTPNKKTLKRMGANLPVIFRQKYFYSFVFEDEEDTIGNNVTNRNIKISETVHKSNEFTPQKVNQFINALQQLCKSNTYNIGILGQYEIVSTQNNTNNTNENMRQNNKVKLIENKLKRMVQESIRQVLNEDEATPIKLSGKIHTINIKDEKNDLYYEQKFNDAEEKLYDVLYEVNDISKEIAFKAKDSTLRNEANDLALRISRAFF